ncbi:MAG: class I SAM-dependent methyltransferase [Thermoanaerobaculia bacterium]
MSAVGERDPWYASWFGEEYLALYPERDDREARHQSAFAGEVLEPYARRGRLGILDLACGTGRHAVVLGRGPLGTLGVVGLDLSHHLLSEARRRSGALRPGYVRSDMRRLPFTSGVFGAVVNFFTSFGYFEDPGDDETVVRETARILAPGGAFLSDVFNAERVIRTLASREEKTIAGQRISIQRRYDPVTRRVEKDIEMGTGASRQKFYERVRAYTEGELRALIGAAGLRIRAAYGDFDGAPFDVHRSARLILLAEKPS